MISRVFSFFAEAVSRLSVFGVDTDKPAATSVAFYPLVGLLIGLFAAVVLLGTGAFFPEPVPVALTLVTVLALTGAVHEKGLMRAADRLVGDATRRTGTMVLVAALGLKASALMGMDSFSAARALIAAHAASRFAMVLAMWALSSRVAETGQGASVTNYVLAIALLLGLFPAVIVLAPVTAALASIGGIAAAAVAATVCVRNGLGATRETFDAVQHAVEIAFLIGAGGVISGPG